MKYLATIFVIVCFFPYVDFFNLGTDTQPTALIVASVILLTLKKYRLNTPIILLGVLFIVSLLFIPTTTLDTFTTAKIILNYLSLPIVVFASYSVFCQTQFKLGFKTFLFITGIYLFVGVMQNYFIHDFLAFMVNMGARGILLSGRGVVSLCPEPSFYGSICLFFMIFSLLHYGRKENIIVAVIMVLQIVLLAKSAIAVAILAFCILTFGIIQLMKLNLKYVGFTLLSFVLFFTFKNTIIKSSEGTRMGEILTSVIDDPLLIAKADPSIAIRLSSTLAPYFLLKHNYFLPKGYGQFRPFLFELNGRGYYKDLLTASTLEQRQRIVGSINMALFQLGFLGLLLPLAIYLSFKKSLHKDNVLFAFILFVSLLFTQIQLMHSMIGLTIGLAIYLGKVHKRTSVE